MNDEKSCCGKPVWKRLWPLVIIFALCALVFFMGWHRYLTLAHIAGHRDELQAFVGNNFLMAIAIYMAVYIAAVALSLPGASLLSITGGFLFGWFLASLATVFAATAGAVIIFLVARYAFGETLKAKAGPKLEKLRAGFCKNALNYLLFLRLVPAFPFWLVNLAPALLGVGLGVYTLGTFIGIIPGTFAFCFLGAGFDSIITAQKAAYNACMESNPGGDCVFSLDAGALITPQILAAFAALGVVALIPVIIRKFRKTNGQD